MESLTLHLTGVSPLLMHAPNSVNPLNEMKRAQAEITKKQASRKTEDDHMTILRLDWEMALYFDEELGPYIPGVNVERCLQESAKITRQGKQIERGVYITEDVPLVYPGRNGTPSRQRLWDGNFKDVRVVGNQQNSVMRCRPMFPAPWELHVPFAFEPSIIDRQDIVQIAERAGAIIGLGDYRPRFGRFTVEVA